MEKAIQITCINRTISTRLGRESMNAFIHRPKSSCCFHSLIIHTHTHTHLERINRVNIMLWNPVHQRKPTQQLLLLLLLGFHCFFFRMWLIKEAACNDNSCCTHSRNGRHFPLFASVCLWINWPLRTGNMQKTKAYKWKHETVMRQSLKKKKQNELKVLKAAGVRPRESQCLILSQLIEFPAKYYKWTCLAKYDEFFFCFCFRGTKIQLDTCIDTNVPQPLTDTETSWFLP